jgi:hypothetical protein
MRGCLLVELVHPLRGELRVLPTELIQKGISLIHATRLQTSIIEFYHALFVLSECGDWRREGDHTCHLHFHYIVIKQLMINRCFMTKIIAGKVIEKKKSQLAYKTEWYPHCQDPGCACPSNCNPNQIREGMKMWNL